MIIPQQNMTRRRHSVLGAEGVAATGARGSAFASWNGVVSVKIDPDGDVFFFCNGGLFAWIAPIAFRKVTYRGGRITYETWTTVIRARQDYDPVFAQRPSHTIPDILIRISAL